MDYNPKIHYIPARPKPIKRVGIYCRVSSSKDEQLKSLSNQISGLTRKVANIPSWRIMDMYVEIRSAKGETNRDVVIQFGDSFSLIVNSDENIGTLDINMSKNLRSINSDYNFLITFSKNFTYEIYGHQLSFGALKNTELDINTIKDDLFKLTNVVKLFNKLKLNNT